MERWTSKLRNSLWTQSLPFSPVRLWCTGGARGPHLCWPLLVSLHLYPQSKRFSSGYTSQRCSGSSNFIQTSRRPFSRNLNIFLFFFLVLGALWKVATIQNGFICDKERKQRFKSTSSHYQLWKDQVFPREWLFIA